MLLLRKPITCSFEPSQVLTGCKAFVFKLNCSDRCKADTYDRNAGSEDEQQQRMQSTDDAILITLGPYRENQTVQSRNNSGLRRSSAPVDQRLELFKRFPTFRHSFANRIYEAR